MGFTGLQMNSMDTGTEWSSLFTVWVLAHLQTKLPHIDPLRMEKPHKEQKEAIWPKTTIECSKWMQATIKLINFTIIITNTISKTLKIVNPLSAAIESIPNNYSNNHR